MRRAGLRNWRVQGEPGLSAFSPSILPFCCTWTSIAATRTRKNGRGITPCAKRCASSGWSFGGRFLRGDASGHTRNWSPACRFRSINMQLKASGMEGTRSVSHDQNFKNLLIDSRYQPFNCLARKRLETWGRMFAWYQFGRNS